jgi:hypothetical protein
VLEVGLNKIKPQMSIGDMLPSSKLRCVISGTVWKARVFHRKITNLVEYAIEQLRERKGAVNGDETMGNKEDLTDVLLRIHSSW